MSKTLTIHLSDAQYEVIRAAAQQAKQSPEELIAATVAARFGTRHDAERSAQTPERQAKDRLLMLMREHGLLVDPKTLPPYPGVENLPPHGSPEEAQLMQEIGDELSDALEQSGLSILDLIERR